MSGIIGVSPNMKSGVIGFPLLGVIGDTASAWLTSSIAASAGETYVNDWSQEFNQNTNIFEVVTSGSPQGIKVLVAGTYACSWSIYTYGSGISSGSYESQYLTLNAASKVAETYIIDGRELSMHSDKYDKKSNCHILELAVNSVIGVVIAIPSASHTISGGSHSGTFLVMSYLSEHVT
jgi:hypothetical protein